MTVRVLQAIGPQYAQDYIARFGFDPKLHPPYLTMGLGAGSVTPLQMVDAYAVFANGGYRVTPYLIARIVDARGNVLSEATPAVAGENAERAIDPRNAFDHDHAAEGRDPRRHGARARCRSTARTSPARPARPTKTSTRGSAASTPRMVGVAWIGFDQPQTLGTNETGAVAALPDLDQLHGEGAQGVPEAALPMPDGVVAVRINADTGLRDDGGSSPTTSTPNFRRAAARRA